MQHAIIFSVDRRTLTREVEQKNAIISAKDKEEGALVGSRRLQTLKRERARLSTENGQLRKTIFELQDELAQLSVGKTF
jgi:predicted RNase H-like nuclease (RuvC/YqgF family)